MRSCCAGRIPAIVTACGVALGDDRMLTVQEGRAVIV